MIAAGADHAVADDLAVQQRSLLGELAEVCLPRARLRYARADLLAQAITTLRALAAPG